MTVLRLDTFFSYASGYAGACRYQACFLRSLGADGQAGAGVEDHVERAMAVDHHVDEDAIVDQFEGDFAEGRAVGGRCGCGARHRRQGDGSECGAKPK